MVGEKARLKKSVPLALNWLADIAIKKENSLTNEKNPYKVVLPYWKGCIRNEYIAGTKDRQIYGPIWHTGQALKSLLLGSKIELYEEDSKLMIKKN